MKKFTLKAQISNIPEAVSLTQDYLKSLKLKNDAVLSALFFSGRCFKFIN